MTRKARPKQMWRPPSAADHNAIAAAGDSYRRGPDGTPEPPRNINPSVIYVKNTTGAAKRQYEVLLLNRTQVLTTIAREPIYCTGSAPAYGGMPKTLAVLLQPIANNAWGYAQIAGICPAYVYVNDANDHFAGFPAAEDRLVSAETGPVNIVQQPSGTGELLCLVNLSWQEESHLVGVPVGDGITARNGTTAGTGYCQLYYLNGSGVLTAVSEGGTGVFVPVYSLSNDPILPQVNNTFDGGSYIGQGTEEIYYPLHCDQFGNWWIEKEYDVQEATAHGVLDLYDSGSITGRNASEAVGAAYGRGTLLINELDTFATGEAALLTSKVPISATNNEILELNKTGDYRITTDWGGLRVIAADTVIIFKLEYQDGGSGAWASYYPTDIWRGVGRSSAPDNTGASFTFSRRLQKGTLLRVYVYSSGTFWNDQNNNAFTVAITVTKSK